MSDLHVSYPDLGIKHTYLFLFVIQYEYVPPSRATDNRLWLVDLIKIVERLTGKIKNHKTELIQRGICYVVLVWVGFGPWARVRVIPISN